MESLDVLQALGDIEGSQKCYLGPKFMDRIGINLGGSVHIHTRYCSYFCVAWPRYDSEEGYIQFDPTVIRFQDSKGTHSYYRCLTESSKMLPNQIPFKDVKKVKQGRIKSVSITVVFEDYRDVTKYKKLSSSDAFIRRLFSLLRKRLLSKGVTVICNKLALGRLHKVAYIIVNSVSCSEVCGTVTENTEIKVDAVSSKERSEQSIQSSTAKKLGGLNREKAALTDTISLPFQYPDATQKFGIQFNRGVLLRGPPGCGKTSLVRLVARETEAYLEYVNGADICGGYPGEGEERLRKIFDKALDISEEGPCVLFIDEIDALCPQRSSKGSKTQERRLVSQLMSLLDNIHDRGNLVVVGATSRPQALDTALRRHGRFEKEIFIGIPKFEQRRNILDVLSEGTRLADDVKLDELAEATPGYSGADLESLIQQAVYDAYMKGSDKSSFTVTQADLEKALHNTTPSTQRGSDILVDYKPVHWEDIGGLDNVKQQLKQAVEWPLKHPDAFVRLGIPRPSGVLLYGPPGCAKTTLVRAAATACHVTFLAVSGAQLFSPFVGDSEKKLAEAFQQARASAPSILFIDEIESLVGKRSSGGKQKSVQERVLSTLLNEMDGIGLKTEDLQQAPGQREAEGDTQPENGNADKRSVDNNDVLLVAATNRPDMIDDALLRPGRIDRLIFVPLPDKQARQKILEVYTKNTPTEGVKLDELAGATEGYTGADLENLCREAALHALTVDGINADKVRHHHFTECLQTIKPSLTQDEIEMYSNLLKR